MAAKWYRNQQSPETPQVRKYAVTEITCQCNKSQFKYTKETKISYCKKCGSVLTYIPIDGLFFDSLEMVAERLNRELGVGPTAPGAFIAAPRGTGEAKGPDERDGRIETLEAERQELEMTLEELRAREAALESERDKALRERNEEVAKYVSENHHLEQARDELESDRDRLRKENDRLSGHLSDLQTTLRHRENEVRAMERVDVHGIVSSFLEYASAVNNIVQDKSDLDCIRGIVSARTEALRDGLARSGVGVSYHRRGDALGDGRVEVSEMDTDDPGLDLRVARCTSMGCTFSSDRISDIPERVTVYRYRPAEAVAEETVPTGDETVSTEEEGT